MAKPDVSNAIYKHPFFIILFEQAFNAPLIWKIY